MPPIIRLKTSEPVVRGGLHDVYQHPDSDDLLIKIPRADRAHDRWFRKRGWIPVPRRYGIYTGWLREIRECLAVWSRYPEYPRSLCRVTGLVETDIGLGLVVEKICDRTGKLAPTLDHMVDEIGLTGDLRQKLDELTAEMIARNVIVGDVHAKNILYASDAIGDRLVIIEGLGDKSFIPVNSLSRYVNRRNIRRQFDRIFKALEDIDRRRAQRRRDGIPPPGKRNRA